jgi:pyruvate,water dikinase
MRPLDDVAETTIDGVRWFENLRLDDVPLVGGKNASLGELYANLGGADVRVPNGFALTAAAYRDALTAADAWPRLHALLDGLDVTDVVLLAERAGAARQVVYDATATHALRRIIVDAYRKLEGEYGTAVAVGVRSSATAEDLPTASFAGQHESYLNISGADDVVEACRRCFASLFTDRAILCRVNNGFDHFKVFMSVGVMKMVRSDNASSGVIFTLDIESGFRDVVFVTGAYGLGENVVQGKVDPDEFHVHKPTFLAGHRAVLRRSLGQKQLALRLAHGHVGSTTRDQSMTEAARSRFCIDDNEVLMLAEYAIRIEQHYSAEAGHPVPMDIEWAKDAEDGRLYIVQARPETVASRRTGDTFESYTLIGSGNVLVSGKAVGEKIGGGVARVIRSADELSTFHPGEVLVASFTSPDWEPVMKTAAAIVTDRGGRTCHAAIVARELGVPAVVGSESATIRLNTGQRVTVSCAGGEVGQVFDGNVQFEVTKLPTRALMMPRTHIMVNLGNPDLAFRTGMMPNEGVGLARMEFIINEHIGVHPMALIHPDKLTAEERLRIATLSRNDSSPREFFVRTLAEGVGTIAAAFWPKPVIIRLSDFKTNEYAQLLGGGPFEPIEANPMLGFRGASRYAHPAYEEGFALECEALRRVRDTMGLTNLKIMVPFCRRVEEAERVIEAMAHHGLERGVDGLEIYVMCEVPNNVIQVDEFAKVFDGFSIGSNDLTQLTLGVDRDSDVVAFDFDERDPGMLTMLRLAVEGAHRNHRHVGICGEAPANYPEIAKFLARLGIDSISVNPSSLPRTIAAVAEAEGMAAE